MIGLLTSSESRDRSGQAPRAVIAVKGMADVQLLPKVAGLVAQFDIIPEQFCTRRSGNHLAIDMEIMRYAGDRVDLLLEKIRGLVTVERASLVQR